MAVDLHGRLCAGRFRAGLFSSAGGLTSDLGAGPLGRRSPAVFAGTLGLACLYVLARRLFGWRVGLTTLGLASITWWSILLGRIVLREVFELPPYVLALYAGWRGLERVWQTGWSRAALRFFILGGVALGVSQYIHTIPRGLFLVFVLFGLYLLIFQRRLFRSAWRGLVVLIVVAEIVAAPLLIYATLHPDVDNLPNLGNSKYDPDQSLARSGPVQPPDCSESILHCG